MFKSILVFVTFLLFQQAAFCQIKWSNPPTSTSTCSKVLFIDSLNGFILNTNGDLLKTTNQGDSWQIVHHFYGTYVFDMHDSTGVMAGYNIMYVSADNGATWQKSPTGFTEAIVDIDVVSRDTIFIAGTYKLYKSFNRGQTWQTINLLNNVITTSFNFINSKIGFIGRSNTSLLKTIDGGQTWLDMLPRNVSSSAFYAVKFLNTDTGFAYRENDTLYKTTNGGITWQRTLIPIDIYGIHFPSASVGYLAGTQGTILRTNDGGSTWSYLSNFNYALNTILTSVYFINPAIGFVVGSSGRISKTTDGGQTWKHNSISYVDITGLAFAGSSTGYATSWTTSYKTTDGAKTWAPLPLTLSNSSSGRFQNAYFFTKDTGYFTSTFPARMYKTNDGGQTWRIINFVGPFVGTTYEDNPGTSVVNDSTAFITLTHYVYGYAIYKTTNRGETWKKIDSTRTGSQTFRQIYFSNEKTGYALRGYELYRTTDSARTWSLVYTNNNTIETLYFLNAKTGFIGDYDGIKRTKDSGRTWSALPADGSIYGSAPTAIRFVKDGLGYFTASLGRVFYTQDSGRSWAQYGNTVFNCSTMAVLKDSLVYMGGGGGTIAYLAADTGWGTTTGCQCSSFTFISDIGGSNSIYQWQVDTGTGFINITDNFTYSGTNARQLIINSVAPAWTNYKYRCLVDINSYSKVHSYRFNAQWIGAFDNLWENPGNWSCGVVPNSNTDVVITSGTLILQNNTTIRSLRLSPGVSFTISPGTTLTILH